MHIHTSVNGKGEMPSSFQWGLAKEKMAIHDKMTFAGPIVQINLLID